MSKYSMHVSKRTTPQSEKAHPDQAENSAGGHSFVLDCWGRLDRFLILGAEGGTYYIRESKLTKDNVAALDSCVAKDHIRAIKTIVDISVDGRAAKPAPCIFALAYLAGHSDVAVRQLALEAVPVVCRTASQLFQFLADVKEFRGWGKTLRNAVSAWYLAKDPRALAYQITKYRQREGESHADTLRRAHTKAEDADIREVLAYAANKLHNIDDGTNLEEARAKFYTSVAAGKNLRNWLTDEKPHRQVLAAVEAAKRATKEQEIVKLIQDHDLVRECIPTQFLNSKAVWDALLVKMPMGAMVRNLGKMSAIGLVSPMSATSNTIVQRLMNQELIQKARIHPLNVLLALSTYQQGHGVRGKLSWAPVPQVCGALNKTFEMAFKNVEPTNKRWLLGLDVSGSMSAAIANTHLSCAQAAGAMAMVTARAEAQHYIHGFSHEFVDLTKTHKSRSWSSRGKSVPGITATSTLDAVMEAMRAHNFGRTDCALPMMHALKHKIPVDVFAVYTDSETWFGEIHPHQALNRYRREMGIDAKLIVVGMAANQFSIADPHDAGMLDIVGFDANAPAVMADFARD